MNTGCKNLEELMEQEMKIIAKHIDNHKYYHKIADKQAAIHDFVDKYGFIMRDMFCESLCQKNKECELYQKDSGEYKI